MISDFRGKRVTVMGLGSFGGGIGAVQFLAGQGAAVTVTDLKPAGELARSLESIGRIPNVILHLGGHDERDFRNADLIVASPAIPRDSRYLAVARDSGIAVTSEMNLFWERNPGRTICVTGSNGKSTTAALIHACMTARDPKRRVWLGGNIGGSLLPIVDQIQAGDWVILELSSFQLEDLAVLTPNPHVAIVTNFTPNHLARQSRIY